MRNSASRRCGRSWSSTLEPCRHSQAAIRLAAPDGRQRRSRIRWSIHPSDSCERQRPRRPADPQICSPSTTASPCRLTAATIAADAVCGPFAWLSLARTGTRIASQPEMLTSVHSCRAAGRAGTDPTGARQPGIADYITTVAVVHVITEIRASSSATAWHRAPARCRARATVLGSRLNVVARSGAGVAGARSTPSGSAVRRQSGSA